MSKDCFQLLVGIYPSIKMYPPETVNVLTLYIQQVYAVAVEKIFWWTATEPNCLYVNTLYTDLYALSKVFICYIHAVRADSIYYYKERNYSERRGNVVPRVLANPEFSLKGG